MNRLVLALGLAILCMGGSQAQTMGMGMGAASVAPPEDVQVAPMSADQVELLPMGASFDRYVLLLWKPVETATSYRIFRQIDALLEDGNPEINEVGDLKMIPWTNIDPTPGVDLMRVPIEAVSDPGTGWGVQAILDDASGAVLSPIIVAEWINVQTAVEGKTWGRVKAAVVD